MLKNRYIHNNKIIPHLPREIGRAVCPIFLIYRGNISIYGVCSNNEKYSMCIYYNISYNILIGVLFYHCFTHMENVLPFGGILFYLFTNERL